jgi:hypothetical protein
MTKEEIGLKLNREYPGVYTPTTAPTKLIFHDGSFKIGYFDYTPWSEELEKQNQFTFIELGEKNEKYRATREKQYITIINADDLQDIVYPSYFEHLIGKLKKINLDEKAPVENDWELYKEKWKQDVGILLNTVADKWLKSYEEANVVTFSLIPVKRTDEILKDYFTMMLEMEFAGFQYIVIEPAFAITSSFNGRLEIYKRGETGSRFTIFRKLISVTEPNWILARSSNPKDQIPFSKIELESIINSWIK